MYPHAAMYVASLTTSAPTNPHPGRVASVRRPRLAIDKSNVARLCAKMVKTAHLIQERAPEDGRARLLVLTAKGQELARSIEQASRARFGSLFAALPRDRRSAVLDAMAALSQAVAASAVGGAAVAPGRSEQHRAAARRRAAGG